MTSRDCVGIKTVQIICFILHWLKTFCICLILSNIYLVDLFAHSLDPFDKIEHADLKIDTTFNSKTSL